MAEPASALRLTQPSWDSIDAPALSLGAGKVSPQVLHWPQGLLLAHLMSDNFFCLLMHKPRPESVRQGY